MTSVELRSPGDPFPFRATRSAMNLPSWHPLPALPDADANRVARQLQVILIGWIGLLIPLVVMVDHLHIARTPIVLLVAAVAIGVCVLLLVLSRRGYPRLASALLGLALWVMTFYVASGSGGVGAPVVVANIALCHQMGVLLGLRGGLVSAIVCSVTVFVLARIDVAGMTPTLVTSASPYRTWLTYSFFMAQAAIIEHVTRAEVSRALAQALAAVREHEHAEKALALRTTELTVHAVELRTAKQEADDALCVKADFLAMMSHEIRTPIAAIHGGLGLLQAGALGTLDPDMHEVVEIAQRNTERLRDLVSELLDLQAVGAGRLQLATEAFDLVEIVPTAIALIMPEAEASSVRVDLELPSFPVPVHGDREKLTQALNNLISNAITFAGDAKRVRVRVRSYADTAQITVTNWGVTIHPSLRERMFEPFRQGIHGETRVPGGAGLGLPLTKAIVELHGGTLDFQSEEGETTFAIAIPRLLAMAA